MISELTPGFVGEISGIDITQDLSPEQVAEIEAGMDRFAVLVFHDQVLTDDSQKAFSTHFGQLEDVTNGSVSSPTAGRRRLDAYMADISNLDPDQKLLARDDRRRLFNLGNQLWHSDSSYKAIPSKYSLLSGRTVVDVGGDTEFADMRAAYDALDDRTKTEVEPLICEHSLMFSRGLLGFTDLSDAEKIIFAPVRQRLVRTHPVTGRKSLYLSAHAGTIVGWPVPEARAYLRDLNEHAVQSRFVYAHKWRQNDLVMWDNRTTMHRGRPFDGLKVRDMRRTTIEGDSVTVEQLAA